MPEPATASPMARAIVDLDTLAVMAGIPDPGRTVDLTDDVAQDTTPPRAQLEADGWPADYALRRVAAWANALVAALPETTR